jgi:putative copper export protein
VLVAEMVNGFSPLALTCGVVVVIFGVITAWRHLPTIDALWTTPYGWALIAKLVFVACVFALGAWNWRRQRPTLGSESAADSIRRSSVAELSVAGVVLVITSILISLPAPPRPKAPGAAGAPGGEGPPPAAQEK